MRAAPLLTGLVAGLLRGAPDNDVRVLLDAASADIKVGHADAKYGVPYLNATAGGREYGCLGCQPALFADYLKHLQPGGASEAPAVQSHSLLAQDFMARRDILQQMWQDRRLVLGGVGGLTDMGFADSLVSLARTSPRVYERNASGVVSKYHVGVETEEAELSGSALLDEMRETWPKIDDLAYVAGDDEANKKHALNVLQRVKSKFEFYRTRCLATSCPADSFPKPPAAQTTMLGTVACTPEDAAHDCVYAEARRCESGACGNAWAEFQRFHGISKLLEVKRGRCSELSRVAYSMYLALGYDARMVIDFTDHVWTEVRLPRGPEGQWYHADPSEAVFDRPLMYEQGWGKKLTFVFGVTPHSVEDVSARYTANHALMVQRRGLADPQLAEQLKNANHRIQFEQPMQHWGYGDTGSTLENVAVLGAFM
jgi:hypothetical protein